MTHPADHDVTVTPPHWPADIIPPTLHVEPPTAPHSRHDCADHRQRVVLGEGDDVFVERCAVCGRVRHNGATGEPLAWYFTPRAAWPWRYAGTASPVRVDDVWRHP